MGSPRELGLLRRLFAVLGMHPVDYYDLSAAGLPVHSTAFRPLSPNEIAAAPFRMFTSLLRPELLSDTKLREHVLGLLNSRDIVPGSLIALINKAEAEGGLMEPDATRFIAESIGVFRWSGRVRTTQAQYRHLLEAHPLVADICCFPGPHINHLTLPSRNIDSVQSLMLREAMNPKDQIEGPPERRVPILLRQTSFRAVPEPIVFSTDQNDRHMVHTARFGEIEQRGYALSREGRALYDRCLGAHKGGDHDAFDELPDDLGELHRAALLAGQYSFTIRPDTGPGLRSLYDLVDAGNVAFSPFTYEDFLPVSAAGIFRSNLGTGGRFTAPAEDGKRAFIEALGGALHSSVEMNKTRQAASLQALREQLEDSGITLET